MEIATEISNCKECKKDKFGLAVPGEGNHKAKVMLVGEAPGREEAKTGRPFVGRSGRLLTEMLSSVGIDRKDVFITSPVKYYPGKRLLTKEEISHGRIHLLKQIESVKPKLIVLLGSVAIRAVIDKKLKPTEYHGKLIEGKYFVTFHPAAAIRSPKKVRAKMNEDFRKLRRLIQFLPTNGT